jgi:hypothetical protein
VRSVGRTGLNRDKELKRAFLVARKTKMSLSDGTHSRTVAGTRDVAWRSRDREPKSGARDRTGFGNLKVMLPAPDYYRMESEWQDGLREIRLEGGFIITCLTPVL